MSTDRIAAFVIAAVTIAVSCPLLTAQGTEALPEGTASEPITLQASVSYGRSDWALRCDADGTCELTQEWPEQVTQTFGLSTEQQEELQQALEETQFFDLPPEISRPVPDATVRTLTVTRGEQSHTVTINFVPNIADPIEREAAQRALQIWHLMRGWFDEAGIPDLRPFDRRWLEQWEAEESETSPKPITLQASVSYGRSDWALRCDADGTCELTQRWPEPVAQTFELSAEQRGELEQALEETQFFDLLPEIGRPVSDGTVRTLTVTRGDQSHTVTINFVPNIADPIEREAAQRALQIWHLVRGWFDEAAVPDLRPFDRQWLERWAPEESEAEPSPMETADQPPPL